MSSIAVYHQDGVGLELWSPKALYPCVGFVGYNSTALLIFSMIHLFGIMKFAWNWVCTHSHVEILGVPQGGTHESEDNLMSLLPMFHPLLLRMQTTNHQSWCSNPQYSPLTPTFLHLILPIVMHGLLQLIPILASNNMDYCWFPLGQGKVAWLFNEILAITIFVTINCAIIGSILVHVEMEVFSWLIQ